MDTSPAQHFQPRAEREEFTPALDDDQLEYPNKEIGYGVSPDHDANALQDTTATKLKLPGSNPALDAVFIPALSDWFRFEDDVKHDPERKSIYPSLDGLGAEERILSFESAMSYQHRAINTRNHPFDDSSLPGVQLGYLQHVKDLYAAMIDVSVSRNILHSQALRHMSSLGRNRKPHYPAVKLVAKAHAIISMVIDGATNGFRKTKNQGQARQVRPDNLYASAFDRLETMRTALKENKNIVAEVLEGDEQTIINFVYAPKALISVRSIALRDSESKVAAKAARGHQIATPSPAPSTPGDTSGGSELSSTGLIPIYPPFDGLPADEQLADLQAAEPHLNKIEERDGPLKSDPYLPLLKQNAFPLFQKLYGAMTDVTEIQNPPASKEYKWFVEGAAKRRKKGFFPVQNLQEVCWRILEEFFDVTEHGFPKAVQSACTNSGVLSMPAGTTSNQRFASILEVLRREKAICARVIKGELKVGVLLCQPYCLVGDVLSGRDRHRRKPAEATADQVKEEPAQSETVKRRRDSTTSPSPDTSAIPSRPAKNPRLAPHIDTTVQTPEPLQAQNDENASLQRGENSAAPQFAPAAAPLQQQPATPVKQEDTHSDYETACCKNNTPTTDRDAPIHTLQITEQQSFCNSEPIYRSEDHTSLLPAENVPAHPPTPVAEAQQLLNDSSVPLLHAENDPAPQSATAASPLPQHPITPIQEDDTYTKLDSGPVGLSAMATEHEACGNPPEDEGQQSAREDERTDANGEETVAPPVAPLLFDDELPEDLFVDEDELARSIEDIKRFMS